MSEVVSESECVCVCVCTCVLRGEMLFREYMFYVLTEVKICCYQV